MKYNQPYGISDPNAPYINGNPSTGTMGSIPPAASIEFDQREVVEVITRANLRGYNDFSDTPCAAADNADLQQLRKAIEGFVRNTPVEFTDLIDSYVTFTVHGTGADFPDLHAALHHLSTKKITTNGRVILQLPGATTGAAAQFIYTKRVIFEHPQNHRIFLFGGPMRSPIPTDWSAYTLTGYSSAARASDTVANLTMLRTKFGTELRFQNGAGVEITGTNLACMDGLLITSDGSTDAGGVYETRGVGLFATNYEGSHIDLRFDMPGHPANGNAVVGFVGHGFYFGQGGNMSTWGLGFPLVAIGNGNGFTVNGTGHFQPVGVVLSYSNGGDGFGAYHHSWMHFDVANCQSYCNGGNGVTCYHGSTVSVAGSKCWGNAGWGLFADLMANIDATNVVVSIGGVYNNSGDINAGHTSIVLVPGIAGHHFQFVPALNTEGNSNALITYS